MFGRDTSLIELNGPRKLHEHVVRNSRLIEFIITCRLRARRSSSRRISGFSKRRDRALLLKACRGGRDHRLLVIRLQGANQLCLFAWRQYRLDIGLDRHALDEVQSVLLHVRDIELAQQTEQLRHESHEGRREILILKTQPLDHGTQCRRRRLEKVLPGLFALTGIRIDHGADKHAILLKQQIGELHRITTELHHHVLVVAPQMPGFGFVKDRSQCLPEILPEFLKGQDLPTVRELVVSQPTGLRITEDIDDIRSSVQHPRRRRKCFHIRYATEGPAESIHGRGKKRLQQMRYGIPTSRLATDILDQNNSGLVGIQICGKQCGNQRTAGILALEQLIQMFRLKVRETLDDLARKMSKMAVDHVKVPLFLAGFSLRRELLQTHERQNAQQSRRRQPSVVFMQMLDDRVPDRCRIGAHAVLQRVIPEDNLVVALEGLTFESQRIPDDVHAQL